MLPKRLSFLKKYSEFLSPRTRWKKQWKDELSLKLEEVQKQLNVSFVTVVSNESDLYFECLFLLSFLGVSVATLVAFLVDPNVENAQDILIYPLLGFCAGATLYHLRRFYLQLIAPRAIRVRVSQKAKVMFYDHYLSSKGPFVMLYLSELEKEALLLASAEIHEQIPKERLAKILGKLCRTYDKNNPMLSVGKSLTEMTPLLQMALKGIEIKDIMNKDKGPLYFIRSTDKKDPLPVAIIRGNKDIN